MDWAELEPQVKRHYRLLFGDESFIIVPPANISGTEFYIQVYRPHQKFRSIPLWRFFEKIQLGGVHVLSATCTCYRVTISSPS